MIRLGIIGAEDAKWNEEGKTRVRKWIDALLTDKHIEEDLNAATQNRPPESIVVVSGHCHLGGVDIWAEEAAIKHGMFNSTFIHAPNVLQWEDKITPSYNQLMIDNNHMADNWWSTRRLIGFKSRNILIAKDSDELYVIVAKEYPTDFVGMKFDRCYHCEKASRPMNHLKSGACWVATEFERLKTTKAIYVVI